MSSGIIVHVITSEDLEKHKAAKGDLKDEPNVTHVFVHDPLTVGDVIKAQPSPPLLVIVSNSFSGDIQSKTKADAEKASPGVSVALIPQGLSLEETKKFLEDLKAKHSA